MITLKFISKNYPKVNRKDSKRMIQTKINNKKEMSKIIMLMIMMMMMTVAMMEMIPTQKKALYCQKAFNNGKINFTKIYLNPPITQIIRIPLEITQTMPKVLR